MRDNTGLNLENMVSKHRDLKDYFEKQKNTQCNKNFESIKEQSNTNELASVFARIALGRRNTLCSLVEKEEALKREPTVLKVLKESPPGQVVPDFLKKESKNFSGGGLKSLKEQFERISSFTQSVNSLNMESIVTKKPQKLERCDSIHFLPSSTEESYADSSSNLNGDSILPKSSMPMERTCSVDTLKSFESIDLETGNPKNDIIVNKVNKLETDDFFNKIDQIIKGLDQPDADRTLTLTEHENSIKHKQEETCHINRQNENVEDVEETEEESEESPSPSVGEEELEDLKDVDDDGYLFTNKTKSITKKRNFFL
jgi:hypothetical protein